MNYGLNEEGFTIQAKEIKQNIFFSLYGNCNCVAEKVPRETVVYFDYDIVDLSYWYNLMKFAITHFSRKKCKNDDFTRKLLGQDFLRVDLFCLLYVVFNPFLVTMSCTCKNPKVDIGIIYLVRTQNLVRTCAYQGVRNISFSENFAYVLNEWSHIY